MSPGSQSSESARVGLPPKTVRSRHSCVVNALLGKSGNKLGAGLLLVLVGFLCALIHQGAQEHKFPSDSTWIDFFVWFKYTERW